MHYPQFTLWTLALYLLLLMIGYAIGEGIHDGHSTTPHIDHSVQVFFTPKDLKLGNVITTFFKGRKPSVRSPHFLPREDSELIPFSPSKLPYLLKLFGFSQASSHAQAMEDTLGQCILAKPIQGEVKYCATSLESMLDFVRGIFGSKTKFRVLSTPKFGKSSNILQNYTIVDEPREIQAPKMVACHTLPYPYVVYYCHHHNSVSKVFQVSLRGEDNSNVVHEEVVAVCHMDTSQWDPDHASFRVLGIKPGSAPVCHFFPPDDLVWVPNPIMSNTNNDNASAGRVSSM